MDATFTAVARLYEQGLSTNEIARRLSISQQKVRKILISIGAIETVESRMQAAGLNVGEICARLNKSRNAVLCRLPYSKGMYMAEYPTINAIRIRKSRQKAKTKED